MLWQSSKVKKLTTPYQRQLFLIEKLPIYLFIYDISVLFGEGGFLSLRSIAILWQSQAAMSLRPVHFALAKRSVDQVVRSLRVYALVP